MKLTEIITLIENEVNIFGNNLYWATFLTTCREERVGYAEYDELIRTAILDFSTSTMLELPKDFLRYVAPVMTSSTKDVYFLISDQSFYVGDFSARGIAGKIVANANGRSYAMVDRVISEPLKIFYYTKHLFRFKLWTPQMAVSSNEYIFYDFRYYKTLNSGTLGNTPPSHTSGTQTNGNVDLVYQDFVFEGLPSGETLDTFLPQVENVFPDDVILWGMLYRIKKMRNLDYSVEFENLENARRLYASRNQALVNVRIGSV